MRTVVVTGGSRGIGAAIVRRFAGAGDQVYFFYEKSAEAAAQVASETGATALRCDVTEEAQVLEAFAQIPPVDVLINNAGIADYNPINWMEAKTFRRITGCQCDGAFPVYQGGAAGHAAASGWRDFKYRFHVGAGGSLL